jgi:hypothetical protein
MNIEGLEVRKNHLGGISYWKDDILVGKKCTKCGEDKSIDKFYIHNKKKGTYKCECKECEKRYREANKEHIKEYRKRYNETNKELVREQKRRWNEANKEYFKKWNEDNKEHVRQYREANKEHIRERSKCYQKENAERIKERVKQYQEANKEHIREQRKQYRENNKEKLKEKFKEWREANLEYDSERKKQRLRNNKKENILKLTEMLEQVNPILEGVEAFGSIYKITNIKTGRVYIGQTIHPLSERYHGGIIKGWISERKKYPTQKFLDELIEEDFVVDEVIAIGICKYHLDKLETVFIEQYDSCNNGYNNHPGNHNTTDGLDEFNEILKTYNLQYIDGKIIKAPTIK